MRKIHFNLCFLFLVCIIFAGFYTISFADSTNKPTSTPASNLEDLKTLVNQVKEKGDGKKADKETSSEEEEKINPAQNYKLIAVYYIGKQLRALIDDLSTSDEPANEYKVGDFLGEEQSFSISKIAFNPTARVEIIDEDGFTYLMKPKGQEDKGGSKGTTTGSTQFPTYSYSSSPKAKTKSSKKDRNKETKTPDSGQAAGTASPAASTPSSATAPPPPAGASPAAGSVPPAQTDSGAQGAPPPALQPAVSTGTGAATQAGGTGAANTAPPPQAQPAGGDSTSPPEGGGLDVSRPSNPFGE